MMNNFVFASLLLVFVATFAASKNVSTQTYFDSANPGKCTVPAPDNLILEPGTEANLKSICAVVKCLKDNGEASLEVCDKWEYQIPQDDCGGFYPQLKNPIDPFPDCCEPEITCDGSPSREMSSNK